MGGSARRAPDTHGCGLDVCMYRRPPHVWARHMQLRAVAVVLVWRAPAFGLAAGQASQERRGGAFGVVFSARTFAVAVGGTAGGFLNPYIGIRGVMLVSAALLVGTVVLFRGNGREDLPSDSLRLP